MKTSIQLFNNIVTKVSFFFKQLKIKITKSTGRPLSINPEKVIALSLFKQSQGITTKKSIWQIYPLKFPLSHCEMPWYFPESFCQFLSAEQSPSSLSRNSAKQELSLLFLPRYLQQKKKWKNPIFIEQGPLPRFTAFCPWVKVAIRYFFREFKK